MHPSPVPAQVPVVIAGGGSRVQVQPLPGDAGLSGASVQGVGGGRTWCLSWLPAMCPALH